MFYALCNVCTADRACVHGIGYLAQLTCVIAVVASIGYLCPADAAFRFAGFECYDF